MRIGGIGVTLLGAAPQDEHERTTATLWFTFIFFPVFPLQRMRIQLLPHRGSGFSCKELKRLPLDGREVLRTYVYAWLVMPVVSFGPLLGLGFGMKPFRFSSTWETGGIVVGIAWLAVFVWKLADWHEARFHPRSTPWTSGWKESEPKS